MSHTVYEKEISHLLCFQLQIEFKCLIYLFILLYLSCFLNCWLAFPVNQYVDIPATEQELSVSLPVSRLAFPLFSVVSLRTCSISTWFSLIQLHFPSEKRLQTENEKCSNTLLLGLQEYSNKENKCCASVLETERTKIEI